MDKLSEEGLIQEEEEVRGRTLRKKQTRSHNQELLIHVYAWNLEYHIGAIFISLRLH